eukprot:scaffold22959_cov18-Tisochrysis_lutea.AAC.1
MNCAAFVHGGKACHKRILHHKTKFMLAMFCSNPVSDMMGCLYPEKSDGHSGCPQGGRHIPVYRPVEILQRIDCEGCLLGLGLLGARWWRKEKFTSGVFLGRSMADNSPGVPSSSVSGFLLLNYVVFEFWFEDPCSLAHQGTLPSCTLPLCWLAEP